MPPTFSSSEVTGDLGVSGKNESTSPSSAPSDSSQNPRRKCLLDADGVYGEQTDTMVEIAYEYELEFVPGTDVQGTVLPSIEQASLEAILPSVFVGKCSVLRLRRRRSSRRHLEPVGVKSLPSDRILDGVECDKSNMVNETNDCIVIEGKLSVFVDDDVDAERENIKEILKSRMSEGDLLSPTGGVHRITWTGLAPHPKVGEAQPANQDTLYLTAFLIGIVVISLVLIVSIIVGFKRRQAKASRERNIDDAEALMAGKTTW